MDEKKQMNRRDFLKIVGISTVGATAAFYGCTPDKKNCLLYTSDAADEL